MKTYILNFSACFILLFTSFSYSQNSDSPIPEDSHQMILVLADSASATKGYLYRFERKNQYSSWEQIKEKIPIVLGRNGLAWGRGLHPIDSTLLPIKIEGDGKSPAGIFTLTYAFGYAPSTEMTGLNINYLEITAMRECIDDVQSQYYNKLVNNNEVDTVDWQSSEKMYFADIYYEQGVVVDQNIDPIVQGAGSCIFLHNWSNPDETSAGCTEMAPENMKEIIYWLDYSAYPVLVPLTKQLFDKYQQSWELPKNINLAN
jgi:L,D-peptidoglycan transpeptidase YkuD (ErfK/YbiS/YcfS/YnhG family)